MFLRLNVINITFSQEPSLIIGFRNGFDLVFFALFGNLLK